MKIIGIDDIEEKKKVLNNKKVIITAFIAVIGLILLVLFCIYLGNRQFREFTDKYIFMKNVTEDNVVSIPLDEAENNHIYTYDKYISVLSKNALIGYNKYGTKEYELKVEVANPIVDVNNHFLLIGDRDGKKIYLVSGNNIVWEDELEGSISRISVNKNGYVSVILSGTSFKSTIQVFDNTGKSLFKLFSNSIVVDSDISGDNKNLSIAEVNTNGTLAQTIIETVSIQKAKEQKSYSDFIKAKLNGDKVPLNMKYQDGNKLVCMTNNSIDLIKDEEYEELISLEEEGKKISYGGIELSNSCFRVIEKSGLLSNETMLEIYNTGSKKESIYVLEGTIKETFCNDSVIALNLGTEAHFIGLNGWLLKKYISNQEIRKIVINSDFAGIIYRNKVEIVDL